MTHLLNTQQASQQIILRSEDAIEKTPFYTYNLQHPIIATDDHFMLIHVNRASIPNSFYDIFERNNRVLVTETLNGVLQDARLITIASGNYSGTRLAAQLQALFRENSTIDYTISFDKLGSGKFTFSHSTANASFVLEFPTIDALNRPLGFDAGITTNSCTTTAPLISTHVCDLAHTHSIIVQSELASNSIISSQTLNVSQILGEIPITSGKFEMISYQAQADAFRLLLKSSRIDEIKLKLVDQHGHTLNLNGLSFSLTLQVDFILKRPNEIQRKMLGLTQQLVQNEMQQQYVMTIQQKLEVMRVLVQAQKEKVIKEAEEALKMKKELAVKIIEEF